MKTIKSLEEIKNTSGKIYVRWSKSIALDNKRGYSLRYGTQAEAGLSVCAIDQSWEDWRILRQLQEYSFLGGSCWIVMGDEIGRGGDNEELLDNVVCIGKVSDQLTSADYLKMWRDETIADEQRRLAKITNEIAIEIVKKSIAKLQTDDRKVWQRIMFTGA